MHKLEATELTCLCLFNLANPCVLAERLARYLAPHTISSSSAQNSRSSVLGLLQE